MEKKVFVQKRNYEATTIKNNSSPITNWYSIKTEGPWCLELWRSSHISRSAKYCLRLWWELSVSFYHFYAVMNIFIIRFPYSLKEYFQNTVWDLKVKLYSKLQFCKYVYFYAISSGPLLWKRKVYLNNYQYWFHTLFQSTAFLE